MLRCPELAIGKRSSKARCFGTLISVGRTKKGWLRAASGIYLDRFYNELSADPKKIDEATRQPLCSALRATTCHARRFRAVSAPSIKDAIDNKALLAKGGK